MNQFQTPTEAIEACDKNCQESWKRFSDANMIKEQIDPDAYHIARTVFWSGYQYGAQFVSGYIASLAKPNNNPKT